jgi:3-deoxy-D-arabino-heptulosonate 7-phosphate (DAHP) synthase class II
LGNPATAKALKIGSVEVHNFALDKVTMCAKCSQVEAATTRGEDFRMLCGDCAEEWDEERNQNEDEEA